MGILEHAADQRIGLHSRHLVGRSRRMQTRIDRPEVSAEHAVIAWTATGWVVRDLGSRNGTWVRGKLLDPGVEAPLVAGDDIAFGCEAATYRLASAEAPLPFAWREDQLVLGESGFLALPSDDDPRILVQHDEDEEGWVLLQDDTRTRVRDGQTVRLDGQEWTLALPEGLLPTVSTDPSAVAAPSSLSGIRFDLRCSADEEYVEIHVDLPERTVPLPPRAHHYLILVLARARLEDEARGVTTAERGWVYKDEFVRMLRWSGNRINLGIHRMRRELEVLGIEDAVGLVERRPTTGQLRLGLPSVSIRPL